MFRFALQCAAGALIYLTIRWIHPQFAGFSLILLPVIVMGVNITLLLNMILRQHFKTMTIIPTLRILVLSISTMGVSLLCAYNSQPRVMPYYPPEATNEFGWFVVACATLGGLGVGHFYVMWTTFIEQWPPDPTQKY